MNRRERIDKAHAELDKQPQLEGLLGQVADETDKRDSERVIFMIVAPPATPEQKKKLLLRQVAEANVRLKMDMWMNNILKFLLTGEKPEAREDGKCPFCGGNH